MTNALQVPTWPDPLDVDDFTNLYATMFGFTIEAGTSVYTIHVKVYASLAAFQAGKAPVADITYKSQDGVFPSFNDALLDSTFVTPMLTLRDWVYNTMKTSDVRFAGSTDL